MPVAHAALPSDGASAASEFAHPVSLPNRSRAALSEAREAGRMGRDTRRLGGCEGRVRARLFSCSLNCRPLAATLLKKILISDSAIGFDRTFGVPVRRRAGGVAGGLPSRSKG